MGFEWGLIGFEWGLMGFEWGLMGFDGVLSLPHGHNRYSLLPVRRRF